MRKNNDTIQPTWVLFKVQEQLTNAPASQHWTQKIEGPFTSQEDLDLFCDMLSEGGEAVREQKLLRECQLPTTKVDGL